MPIDEAEPRVCVVLKRPLGAGGLQLQARSVIGRLRALEVECGVIVHSRSREGTRRIRACGIPVDILECRSNALFHSQLLRHLVRHRGRYDVVHVHGCGPEAATAALGASLAGGKPVIVKPSTAGPGTQLGRWAAGGALRPLSGWLLRQGVWRWVAVSDRVARDLRAAGVPKSRIVAIPNGVDTARCAPLPERPRAELRARLDVRPWETVVCAVARLAPHKQIDMLIRAVVAVRPLVPGLRLWIIGDGEERQRLSRIAMGSGCTDRIDFLGQVRPEQVVARLQASDLYVACSRWEGLSNALLEAMACGVAPISTRVSGAEDLIWDGENGRLVEPDDEGALRATILDLADDPAGRTRMGAGARVTVCAGFSLEQTTASLVDLYRAAVDGRERRTAQPSGPVRVRPGVVERLASE